MKSRVSTTTSPAFTCQTFVLSITQGCSLQTALTQIHRRQKHLSNKSAPRPESPRLLCHIVPSVDWTREGEFLLSART